MDSLPDMTLLVTAYGEYKYPTSLSFGFPFLFPCRIDSLKLTRQAKKD